ncbi:sulfatase-like hydrolase/transferase [Novipirellula artificiosorum]|nr:sulfatase-like hydrolase/transferase [Novipirellula artificiosorum]
MPNIVLVMSDDQGWGQVGYMGHPHLQGKTPHMDAMAESGIRFNRFYAAAPVCSPTRASVLTGRVPARTGVPGLHKRLCLQEKTLPQALKKAGYATAHFGKWHLGGVKGSAMPVLPDDPNHPGHYGFDEWLSATNYIEMNPLMTHNGKIVYLEGESSILMVEAAQRFMKTNRDRPFFAVLWYGSPHFPYTALEEDREGLPKSLDPRVANLFGEIIAMDRSIGMLRQGLRDMGLAENTLIWFCSDNGGRDHEPDSVGGLRGFKGSLYEGGIRVPGIIEWPGRIQPMVTDFPASTMDIMPTIVDLLDLPDDSMLDVVDGASLASLLDGKTPDLNRTIPFTSNGTALIEGNYKLFQEGRGKAAKWVLYDLKMDPKETVDISKENPERFEQMVEQAEKMLASVEASAAGMDYPEGKVIQPQRGAEWFAMEEYQALYETFSKLKPGWSPPAKGKMERDQE